MIKKYELFTGTKKNQYTFLPGVPEIKGLMNEIALSYEAVLAFTLHI